MSNTVNNQSVKISTSQLEISVNRFEIESNERFKNLDRYMHEKAETDPFVLKAHQRIGEQLDWYLTQFAEEFKAQKEINMMDIGPAIGAVSTFVYFDILKNHGLLDKLKLHFVDIVPEVLVKTKNFNFSYPDFLDPGHTHETIAKKLYANSKLYTCSIADLKLSQLTRPMDIVIAGFTYHHIHPRRKHKAALAVGEISKSGAFLGIAEEFFRDYENDFAIKHANDDIPIPIEAPIRMESLIAYLAPEWQLLNASYDMKEYYTIVAIKDDPTVLAELRDSNNQDDDAKIYISKPANPEKDS